MYWSATLDPCTRDVSIAVGGTTIETWCEREKKASSMRVRKAACMVSGHGIHSGHLRKTRAGEPRYIQVLIMYLLSLEARSYRREVREKDREEV